MQLIETKEQFETVAKGHVLSIGNFDGVHVGHQELLRRAKVIAKKHDTGVSVMTFWPHPATILRPEKALRLLTPLPLKKKLLEENGVDCLIVLSDTYSLLNLSPKNFVDEFLMKNIKPVAMVEGVNFTFGYGRSGNVLTLRDMGRERGFEVVIIEPKEQELSRGQHHVVSSSLIRGFLENGNVKDAMAALTRPYKLIGQTIPGRGKGSEIGFPTANIEPLDQVIPAEGVYAGFVEIGETIEEVCVSKRRLPAAISIGRAKTFVADHPLLLEAHILNDNVSDLYGKWLAMDFIARIRPQHRFENVEVLKAQIAKDCEQIRKILTETRT
jgi:riboflavin kinase / FMN adenylyltransferase